MAWSAPDRIWPQVLALLQETGRPDFKTAELGHFLEDRADQFREHRPSRWSLRIQLGASRRHVNGSLEGYLSCVLRALRHRGLLNYNNQMGLWSLKQI
jgi:hypothetical protein